MKELFDDAITLPAIDFSGSFHDGEMKAVFPGGCHQGGGIFAEARTTPTEAGAEETGADARIEADSAGDFGDIGTDALSKEAHFVNEADLEGEEGVGGVFNELGGSEIGGKQRHSGGGIGAREVGGGAKGLVQDGPVERIQDFERARLVGADDDAIRIEAIVQSGAFAEKFGIGGDGEFRSFAIGALIASFPNERSDPVAAADGDGGFIDHDGKIAAGVLSDRTGSLREEFEIGRAGGGRRGADGDKDDFRAGNSIGVTGGEFEIGHRFFEQGVQIRLINRDPAGTESFDFPVIGVQAGNRMAGKGQTNTGGEADIASSDNGNTHWEINACVGTGPAGNCRIIAHDDRNRPQRGVRHVRKSGHF